MKKTITVTAGKSLVIGHLITELWNYRGLILAFSMRDLKVKYFQTILGPLWVIMTPLITVGVMTFVFGLMIKVPSDGLPYLLFYLTAIVPWYAFINVMNQTLSSLESHAGLISKIYFPRLVIAASYAVNGAVDFLVGYAIALCFATYFSVLSLQFILLMPLLLFMQMALALGIGLLLAPMNAKYRDVKHMIPLFIQLYYFANPIVYPVSVAPAWAQWIYKINPFAIVITTYRSSLNGRGVDWMLLLYAFIATIFCLVVGAVVFMRREQDLVDVL